MATDPQEYLNFVELLGDIRDVLISFETHVLLMTAVAEAIAAIDFADEPIATDVVLSRAETWAELSIRELPSIQDPKAVRDGVQRLRWSTAHWQGVFQARADRKSDRE